MLSRLLSCPTLALSMLTLASSCSAPSCLIQSNFEVVGSLSGPGRPLNRVVGPGPEAGSERLYIAYHYTGIAGEVVAVDTSNGRTKVFPFDDPRAVGAWGIATGPDGNVYVGTLGVAKLYRIDPKAGAIRSLGAIDPQVNWVWQMAFGVDGKLYMACSPHSKLVRFDPKTSQFEDLGKASPTMMTARTLATSRNGWVYVAYGFEQNGVAAYSPQSGRLQPVGFDGMPNPRGAQVWSVAGESYARIWPAGNGDPVIFRLNAGQPVAAPDVPPAKEIARDPVSIGGEDVVAVTPGLAEVELAKGSDRRTLTFDYSGKAQFLYRIGAGPEDRVATSTLELYRIVMFGKGQPLDADPERRVIREGESYNFLTQADRLFVANYGQPSALFQMRPGQPVRLGNDANANPIPIPLEGIQYDWRPEAMIWGPNDHIFIGAKPGYGQADGLLVQVDPQTRRAVAIDRPLPGRSIASLARVGDRIVGGTSGVPGSGAIQRQGDAMVFAWDPATRGVIDTPLSLGGAQVVTGLTTLPDGRVLGFAGGTKGANQVFMFDPKTQSAAMRETLPGGINVGPNLFNAAGLGPDGKVYALFDGGIFSVDPDGMRVKIEARYEKNPNPITGATVHAGFLIQDGFVYFGSANELVRWKLP